MIRLKGKGIPKAVRGEDTPSMLVKLFQEKAGLTIDKKEIASARRTNNKTGSIIIRYKTIVLKFARLVMNFL